MRGGELAESTYCRVWRQARVDALTADGGGVPAGAAGPTTCGTRRCRRGSTPGVPSTQVAEWAGHSVAVLLQIYAKCLAGQEDAARRRIAAALGGSEG